MQPPKPHESEPYFRPRSNKPATGSSPTETLPATRRMSETENLEVARRLIGAYASDDESDLELLVGSFYRDHAPGGIALGPEALRESLRRLRTTFVDRRLDVEDIIAAQDRVVARVRFSAIHVGEIEGIAATGRRVETEQVHIWRVAGDRLAEHWIVRDDLTALRQIGARIEPARS